MIRADAHGFHQHRQVVDVQRVDNVSAQAVADDGRGIAFKRRASEGYLQHALIVGLSKHHRHHVQ